MLAEPIARKRGLAAYASKYGATREIAERIGTGLRDAGLPVDVLPAERVLDLSKYDPVVLGSAVYVGNWRKPAVSFLQGNLQALSRRPVWLFSSGPTGEGDAEVLLKGWRMPENLEGAAAQIRPRGVAVSHGAADPKKLNLLERWIMRRVKAPVGDFRDWIAVSAWAASIADALMAP